MPPPNSRASKTFSRAVSVGTSWKNWKMIPTCWPRQRASAFSPRARNSCPAKMTRPEVGRSMPVSILSSVDLPLPDGPLTANRLCAGMVKVTSSRMLVCCARVAMMRVRCSTRINGLPCGNEADCLDVAVCAMSDLLCGRA